MRVGMTRASGRPDAWRLGEERGGRRRAGLRVRRFRRSVRRDRLDRGRCRPADVVPAAGAAPAALHGPRRHVRLAWDVRLRRGLGARAGIVRRRLRLLPPEPRDPRAGASRERQAPLLERGPLPAGALRRPLLCCWELLLVLHVGSRSGGRHGHVLRGRRHQRGRRACEGNMHDRELRHDPLQRHVPGSGDGELPTLVAEVPPLTLGLTPR